MRLLLTLGFTSAPFLVYADLRSRLQAAGVEALYPGDPSYATAVTPFNKRLEFAPAAIAFPNSTAQVSAVVKAGAEEGIPVNAKSGGHSYAAFGLGGASKHLIADLSRLTSITVNTSTKQAVIQTGNRLGDVALALSQYGRALPHGTCSYVGVGGHVGMGGYGYTSRQWGLTLDNVVGHEVVLANGTVAQASADAYSDLFWALRGASPSFGIVTAMTLNTYDVPATATDYYYSWDLNVSSTASAISAWQSFSLAEGTSKELGGDIALTKGSEEGRVGVALEGAYYADSSELNGALGPFLSTMPRPSQTTINTTDWITSLQILAGNQPLSTSGYNLSAEHNTFYAKSITTPAAFPISNTSIQAFSTYLAHEGYQANVSWFVQLELWGGPQSRITSPPAGVNSTSFSQRDELWTIQFYASSDDGDPPYPASGLSFLDNMVGSITASQGDSWPYGAYPNYVDGRLPREQWQWLYYKENYDRLSKIKGIYDPANVFNFPQAILPS